MIMMAMTVIEILKQIPNGAGRSHLALTFK